MKEVKKYVCEVCGSEYDEKKEAQACERGHKIPMDIIKAGYVPKTHEYIIGYPTSITVKMSDGKECVYRLLEIV